MLCRLHRNSTALLTERKNRQQQEAENYRPLPPGVFTPENFLTPQHRPPLEVLRVPTRLLVGSISLSAIGGYCISLNHYRSVY